jgi:hypothetical protein
MVLETTYFLWNRSCDCYPTLFDIIVWHLDDIWILLIKEITIKWVLSWINTWLRLCFLVQFLASEQHKHSSSFQLNLFYLGLCSKCRFHQLARTQIKMLGKFMYRRLVLFLQTPPFHHLRNLQSFQKLRQNTISWLNVVQPQFLKVLFYF